MTRACAEPEFSPESIESRWRAPCTLSKGPPHAPDHASRPNRANWMSYRHLTALAWHIVPVTVVSVLFVIVAVALKTGWLY